LGIVAYFLHVDAQQLQAVRERPAIVWEIQNDPRFASARIVDIDKDWQIISWLVSPKKRKEQEQFVVTMHVMESDDSDELMTNKVAFEAAFDRERKKLGFKTEEVDAIPTDKLLEAFEGRGTDQQREAKLNFGLGGARVFSPVEVQSLVAGFEVTKDSEIRARFNRDLLTKHEVGGINWMEESDSVLDEILLPAFHKIGDFYREAAQRGHYVLVIYQ
jgi:hypothetical protein